jgi:hypothetical protein
MPVLKIKVAGTVKYEDGQHAQHPKPIQIKIPGLNLA